MPQFVEKEEKKEPQKKEMLLALAVVVFLAIGTLLKKAEIPMGAILCWILAVIFAVIWVMRGKQEKPSQEEDLF